MKLHALSSLSRTSLVALTLSGALALAPACGKGGDAPAEATAPAEAATGTEPAAGAEDAGGAGPSDASEGSEEEASPRSRRATRDGLRLRDGKLPGAGRGLRPELRTEARPAPVPDPSPPVAGADVDPYPAPTAPDPALAAPTDAAPADPAEAAPADPSPVAPADPALAAPPLPAAPAAGASALLDIERFMPLAVLRDLVGERRILSVGPLAGQPSSATYNSIYFAVPGQETFGASVQVWQDGTRRDNIERFRRMRAQSPNASDIKQLEPVKAFYAAFGPIQTLTLSETNKRLVVAVSCGQELCTHEKLLKLARHAQQQL